MRKMNSLKNLITSLIPFVVLIVVGFWKINVWQSLLSESVYAINQLFFQIFAYLSLVEAGIGALVLKEYYRLLPTGNREEISIYYTLSRRMLRRICWVILLLGAGISFFLPMLSKNTQLSDQYIRWVFMLFLVKNLVDYYMFSPRFVIQADQKIYKLNIVMNAYRIAEVLLEIVLILQGWLFEHVLLLTLVFRVLMNWHVNRIVLREYPWLKIVEDTQGYRLTGMEHILVYKVVSVIYENVDLLLVSAYINPLAVIVYSNYKYITKYVSDLLYVVGSALTSSVGNLLHTEERMRSYHTYETINTLFHFLATFFTVAIAFTINSFIAIWVGSNKILDVVSLFCMMFLFFHGIVRRPQYILKDVFVLYKEMQLVSIVESVLNLVLSFLLVRDYGIPGVLVATVISTVVTNLWYFPLYLYKKVFAMGPWIDYAKYLLSLIIVAVVLYLSFTFYPEIPSDGYVSWLVASAVYACAVFVVVAASYFVIFGSFRQLLKQIFQMIQEMRRV